MSLTQRATTRLRLSAFSKAATALVRQMEDYGWTGRIGSNNHAFMLAPDGTTTCSVSPKEGSPRHRGNQASIFKAWVRQMEEMSAEAIARSEQREMEAAMSRIKFVSRFKAPETSVAELVDLAIPHSIPEWVAVPAPAPVDTAPEPVEIEPEPTPVRVEVRRSVGWCPLCEIDFRTLQAVAVHRNHKHIRELCPICERAFSPAQLTRHTRIEHDLSNPQELARQLFLAQQQLAQARQDAHDWQVLAEEAEGRFAALRDHHNGIVMGINELLEG